MSKSKTLDPDFAKAYTQAIHQEERIRMQWYSNYEAKSSKKSELNAVTPDPEVAGYLKKRFKEGYFKWPIVNGTGTILRYSDPPKVMSRVPKVERVCLYDGNSAEDKGRAKYLKLRYKHNPDEKYFRPLCSSWDYGWKYEDQMKELQCCNADNCNIMDKCAALSKYRCR